MVSNHLFPATYSTWIQLTAFAWVPYLSPETPVPAAIPYRHLATYRRFVVETINGQISTVPRTQKSQSATCATAERDFIGTLFIRVVLSRGEEYRFPVIIVK